MVLIPVLCPHCHSDQVINIGKYLSSLRKLDHIIAPKAGFEAQL